MALRIVARICEDAAGQLTAEVAPCTSAAAARAAARDLGRVVDLLHEIAGKDPGARPAHAG